MAHADGPNAVRVVVAAMAGNLAIAFMKFVAAALSGSVAILAEGVHSVADTANQALLLLGMRLARVQDPARHPFGRAKERYFWGFIVALVLFSLGGVFAIYEGVHKLLASEHGETSPLYAVIVLVVSLGFELSSFTVAWREFKKARGSRGLWAALFQGKDPTIPIVLLEDGGALLGLVIALVAVVTAWITGSVVPDAIGSIAIGLLLGAIGLLLARDTRSLLIGEGVTPEVARELTELAEGTPGVEAVTQLLSYHLGPHTVVLALKVRFPRRETCERIEAITNDLEARIRAARPEVERIFVEADGTYDAAQDRSLHP